MVKLLNLYEDLERRASPELLLAARCALLLLLLLVVLAPPAGTGLWVERYAVSYDQPANASSPVGGSWSHPRGPGCRWATATPSP